MIQPLTWYDVCSDPTMVGFGLFLFPPSQKKSTSQITGSQIPNRTKVSISFHYFGVGFVFLGIEPNNNVVGKDNPHLPRANKNIARARQLGKKASTTVSHAFSQRTAAQQRTATKPRDVRGNRHREAPRARVSVPVSPNKDDGAREEGANMADVPAQETRNFAREGHR